VNATWLVTLSVTDAWSWPAIPVLVSLMLTYTLMRWGSGREMAAGVMAILVSAILAGAVLDSGRSPVQWSFALAFTLLPAAIGLTMRFRAEAVRGEIRDARMAERQRLARELHDTVAHHVSAIAVQAQAARAVFATRPDAAADALRVIEQEASSTLDDMREIVGVLRDGTDAETVPQRGLRDIERLALESDAGPAVEVRLSGELGDLSPSVEAGLYRLVQESVTNARKHAHQARQILITIAGTPDRILLTVDDDGEPATRRGSGFGLVGMEERAELLGGRFTAGPGTARGWHVQVDLPRRIGRTA